MDNKDPELPQDEQQPTPTLLERFAERLRKLFAPDIDPTDQTRILLRFAMIIGIVYYLGMGIFGILTA